MKYTKGNLVLTTLGSGKIVDFIPGTLGKYIHYKVKLHNKQIVWVTEQNYEDFERPYIIKKMGCKPFLELSIDNAIKLLKDNGYLISKVV